jgi:diaminopimelate decarboxylase
VLTTERRNPETLVARRLKETRPGDLIVVERAGAYCSSMCVKNFNSFPEAPEILRRKDRSFVLIRKRQTLEQMIESEIIPF